MKKLMQKIEKQFKNIGKKIKSLALYCYVLEFIGGIIAVICLAVDDWNPVWLLLLAIIPAAAWVATMPLYAFGEIVDNTTVIAKATKESNNVIEEDELPEL